VSTRLRRIGFLGHSHLAVVSAVAAAEKTRDWGTEVLCLDWQASGCRDPVARLEEPDLPSYAARQGSRLRWSQSLAELPSCELVFLAWDVPTNEAGLSDLSGIRAALDEVLPRMAKQASLIVMSQVPPGFTRSLDFPRDRLFYQVETLIFGEALARALSPERLILGSADKAQDLPSSYQGFLDQWPCPQWRMNYESAELSKTAINAYLAATLTVTNTLANFCEALGADWSDMRPALQSDRRIGPYAYLDPGLGLAGGNLKRDLVTLCQLGAEQGLSSRAMAVALRENQARYHWVLDRLRACGVFDKPLRLGIWGLTYKPNTASLKDAPSLAILKALPDQVSVLVFDPLWPQIEQEVLQVRSVEAVLSPGAASEGVDLLLILTPWAAFRMHAGGAGRTDGSGPKVVIDPHGIWPDAGKNQEGQVWQLGQGRERWET